MAEDLRLARGIKNGNEVVMGSWDWGRIWDILGWESPPLAILGKDRGC